MRENSLMIRVENVKKQYRLGQIGGGTLRGDLQSWWARKRGKEDPNTLIGTDQRLIGTTFMALNGVSFTVNKGEAVGIIGSNGAGKSTLVSLISRFYDPTVGHVLIDGIDARDWPLATLRSQVCIVAQDTFLFSDTIGGNIGFGASGDSDDRYIQKMAQIAGADNFIRSMPQGYDTVVGERGVGLSGGQKQRLSLARALADNPSILIMDDTTSAVDMETRGGDPEAPQGDGRRQDHRRHRPPHLVGQGFRPDSGARARTYRRTRLTAELVAAHGRYWDIYHKQLGLQSGVAQGF